jgi:hypothetical protein
MDFHATPTHNPAPNFNTMVWGNIDQRGLVLRPNVLFGFRPCPRRFDSRQSTGRQGSFLIRDIDGDLLKTPPRWL